MSRHLSKSKYVRFCQCPKAMWLTTHRPELEILDAKAEERFRTGNEVGDLAMSLLGPYTDVTVNNTDGSLDLAGMIEKTAQCLNGGTENICEASLSYGDCYCAVDILHKTDAGYEIYEVKSTTDEDRHIDTYVQDVSYQKYVLTHCGLTITGTYLVYLDRTYKRGDTLDIHKLFVIMDISELVEKASLCIENGITDALQTINASEEPACPFSDSCKKPYVCGFRSYCMRELPEFNVYGLNRIDIKKASKWQTEGKITFDDIKNEKLTKFQNNQVACTLNGTEHIDKNAIKAFLDTLTYPLYFLDFETMQYAIPPFKGTWPYEQIPFQYSLHYINEPGGEFSHKEFLAESGVDPRRAIAERLCEDIPSDVCCLAYNKSFECGRLEELAEAFPDLAEHLRAISSNMKDLIIPFRSGDYYTPAMKGSSSIKFVLPALFPDDPSLDYHNLSGGVQNGGEAMTIFPKIKDMSPEDQIRTRKALLEYCGLDTWAMVMIWRKLLSLV